MTTYRGVKYAVHQVVKKFMALTAIVVALRQVIVMEALQIAGIVSLGSVAFLYSHLRRNEIFV